MPPELLYIAHLCACLFSSECLAIFCTRRTSQIYSSDGGGLLEPRKIAFSVTTEGAIHWHSERKLSAGERERIAAATTKSICALERERESVVLSALAIYSWRG